MVNHLVEVPFLLLPVEVEGLKGKFVIHTVASRARVVVIILVVVIVPHIHIPIVLVVVLRQRTELCVLNCLIYELI